MLLRLLFEVLNINITLSIIKKGEIMLLFL